MKFSILSLSILLLIGCTNFTAKQPYRTINGEQMLISADMPNGYLKIRFNEEIVINESTLNQDKSISGVFSNQYTNVYTSKYRGEKVMARCHFPEKECDVFLGSDYAANLVLR
ncbi:hypothetical protein GKR71_00425 [Providencia sp. wls1922]|uniref:hypothetical protein n=1 Tax=Providencia sp. wls1922 TaxID=2675152 RepID=UPI0012B5E27A|nr:hypothetical protein [Providencia sp. wls1922]MTC44305.1 hypothetical protein [Providencia sp. wls1922]